MLLVLRERERLSSPGARGYIWHTIASNIARQAQRNWQSAFSRQDWASKWHRILIMRDCHGKDVRQLRNELVASVLTEILSVCTHFNCYFSDTRATYMSWEENLIIRDKADHLC